MEKSDHIMIAIETDNDVSEEDQSYTENRKNYGKVNIDDLKKLYEEMDCEKLKGCAT